MPVVLATFGPNLPYWSMASTDDGSGNQIQTVGISGTVTTTPGTVAQGSATAGQSGMLDMGAVTTANPAYSTGQTSPSSLLTTTGQLRVGPYSSAGTDVRRQDCWRHPPVAHRRLLAPLVA